MKKAKHVLSVLFFLSLILLGTLFFLAFITVSPFPPPLKLNNIDQLASSEFFVQVDQQFQQRFPGLFLETYAANYQFNDDGIPILTGQVYLRFAGWRKDWFGDLLTDHSIARVEIDTNRGEMTEFEYVHGDAFGFDAPLDLTTWPVTEEKLFNICDNLGAGDFREVFQIDSVFVNATVNKPGREWTASYTALPYYFNCMINLDTGEILTKNERDDWLMVGSLFK